MSPARQLHKWGQFCLETLRILNKMVAEANIQSQSASSLCNLYRVYENDTFCIRIVEFV